MRQLLLSKKVHVYCFEKSLFIAWTCFRNEIGNLKACVKVTALACSITQNIVARITDHTLTFRMH